MKTNRLLTEKPYPSSYWIRKPVKAVFIVLGMISGVMWVIGGLIEYALPMAVTRVCAIACILIFSVYIISGIHVTHRRERFAESCMRERKAKIAEFHKLGFEATRKFIGSSRVFAVDERMGKWYLIDYFNDPGAARLHDIASITGVCKGLNREWIPRGHIILLSQGGRLNRKDDAEYFSREGVVVALDDPDCPDVFINCFKTENDTDRILGYLQSLLRERHAHAEGNIDAAD